MKNLAMTATGALMLLVAACQTTPDVPPVAGWETFTDQFFRVSFMQPTGWQVQKDPSRVTITSSLEAMEKFFDPYGKNAPGSQLIISGDRTDSVRTLDDVFAEYRKGLEESGFQIVQVTDVTIDGNAAKQIEYQGRFDERTALKAVRAITYKDTTVYYVHYGGFNEFYEPYRPVYDSALATLTLPRARVTAANVDPSLPVEETDRFSNEFVEFMYPANFSPAVDKPTGGVEYAMTIKGYRQDCFITIDIRPAQGLSLDKVVEQNSKNFKGASKATATTVGGEQAKSLTYTPTRGVDGRVYFAVKNDKFYRIIMIYATSLKNDFQPAFEKTIASLRLK